MSQVDRLLGHGFRIFVAGAMGGVALADKVAALPLQDNSSNKDHTGICLDFNSVANIDYQAAIWNPETKAYESKLTQKSKPNQSGYVKDIQKSGSLYEAGKAGPLITFPEGARVVGFRSETTERVITLPDGTKLKTYHTCYIPETLP